eukprot:598871-Pyramimonas_sp.AAC.1
MVGAVGGSPRNHVPGKPSGKYDLLRCLGGPQGASLGARWGPIGASRWPLGNLAGLLGSLLMASGGVLEASQAVDLERSRSSGPLGSLLGLS